jgi:tetratricopeptide (TPR) repeat protein
VYPSIASPVQGNFSVAGIAGTNDAELTLLFGFGNKVEKRIKVKLDAKNAASQGNTYKIWAQKKIAELDLNYEKNRAELTKLGQQFGIVTRNTSLIVLETISDYVRYSIEPPATEPELLAAYQRRAKGRESQRNMERNMLKEAVAVAENIKKWWNTDFKPLDDAEIEDEYPMPSKKERLSMKRNSDDTKSGEKPRKKAGAGGKPRGKGQPNPPGSPTPGSSGKTLKFLDYQGGMDDMLNDIMGVSSLPTITIKPIKKDNDYLNKLTGKIANDYQIYLKLRDDYANSSTFYFDMADWFYTLGDRETALRILTSIADLELENASLYRLLGYRFKEYGEYALEKFVCQKVIQWRPMEPQSYRDYALALADNGEIQAAIDSLWSLIIKPYSDNIHSRSRGMAEVVVMEINHLITKKLFLNISKIDKRLLIKIPVDIRVVINWNMDNTDIDLHVKDPYEEESSYNRKKTSIGGRISPDITSGYGPEQFLLKKAVKGKYQIYVNYYGDRQFTSAGPSTVMAEIYIKYAGRAEQRKVVSLQMSKAKKRDKGKVEVAEFEF